MKVILGGNSQKINYGESCLIFSDPLETTVLYPSLFTSHFSTPQPFRGTFYSFLMHRWEGSA